MGYRKQAEPQDLLIELLAMLGLDTTLRFLSRTIHIFIATFLAEIPRQTSRKHPTATQKPPPARWAQEKTWGRGRKDWTINSASESKSTSSPSCRHRVAVTELPSPILASRRW
ncbi:hypothetical protein Pla52o_44190 [Novipirellula galeiformis]|uniref:Uncharacterized protein n=1 Tax=Novipirellula galeiformis TaxID=2528004 RepID=A0A5C6CAN8_9BACT|nr:hypothetical protein Pla52o_44190 [Novipirellula galeiformis]